MRRRLSLLASLLVLGLLGVTSSAMALEPSPHEMTTQNNKKMKEGRLEGTEAGVFEDTCGVSIPVEAYNEHPSNFLYTSDYYHDRVDVFYAFGYYNSPPPGGEIAITNVNPGNGPCALAVDSWGDIFVNDWRENVQMLTPSELSGIETPDSGTTYTKTTLDGGENDTGVAVVQFYHKPCAEWYCTPEEHQDIYVDDGTYISEYEVSEKSQIPRVTKLVQTIGADPSAEYYGVGVSTFPSTNGYIYVADAATDTVKVFNPAVSTATPVEEIDGAGTPQHGFDYLGESTVTVDDNPESPSFGHIYVMDDLQHNVSEHPEVALDEFTPRGAYRGQISHWIAAEGEPPVPTEHWLTASEPNGVTLDSSGDVFVTSGNDEGSEEANRKDVGSLVYMFDPMKLSKPLIVKKEGGGGGEVVSAPAGINCGSACEAEYTKEAGEIIKLTATPDAHSAFVGWSGGCTGTEPVCHVTMEKTAIEVNAIFEALPQQTLTVSVKGSGSGVVTSEPAGIDCAGGTCSEGFNEGSTVTLRAEPGPHNKLAAWSGPDAAGCSTSPECNVTMTAARAVEAEFSPIPQKTLSVAVNGDGTVQSEPSGISCPSLCAGHYDEEGTITLVASPAPHQELAQWSGCTSQAAPTECTVAMNGHDRSVSADFTPIRHRLSVTIVGGGVVSADHGGISGCTGSGGGCSAFYLDGEIVRLSAAAAPGYQFAGWSGGVCGGTGTCEVRLEANASVTANFAAPPSRIPPPPPVDRIHLRKSAITGATATLTVNVSSAGAVSAAGRLLTRAHADVKEAGSAVLHVELTQAGLRALERSRRHRLKVSVDISFSPSSGANRVVITHVLIFRGGRHHTKHAGHGKRRR